MSKFSFIAGSTAWGSPNTKRGVSSKPSPTPRHRLDVQQFNPNLTLTPELVQTQVTGAVPEATPASEASSVSRVPTLLTDQLQTGGPHQALRRSGNLPAWPVELRETLCSLLLLVYYKGHNSGTARWRGWGRTSMPSGCPASRPSTFHQPEAPWTQSFKGF